MFSAEVDPFLTWQAEFVVTLGGLEHRWTQGPYFTGPATVLEVTLELPGEAFLDPLAADYLSGLLVRVSGTDAEGRRVGTVPTTVMALAWPEGRDRAPVVWDRATARERAPNGIVSAAARAALRFPLEPDEILEPPLVYTRRNADLSEDDTHE